MALWKISFSLSFVARGSAFSQKLIPLRVRKTQGSVPKWLVKTQNLHAETEFLPVLASWLNH